MGIRGELFTLDVKVKNRTYFFNVKENRTGDIFLQIVETKSLENSEFERRTVVVFEDDMRKFLKGFDDALSFIEKERKVRQKERAEKRNDGREARARTERREQRGERPGQRERPPRDGDGKGKGGKGRRVRVIAGKK